jgi:hypothetical protein
MALIDVVTAKTFLGVTGTTEDDLIALLCTQADSAIKRWCKWDIEQTTYPAAGAAGRGDSGYYDGDGTRYLRLRETPVTSITSLNVDPSGRSGFNPDGAFASDTLWTAGSDYQLVLDGCLPGTTTKCSYSGLVERINGVWPARYRFQAGRISPTLAELVGCIKVAYVAGYPAVPDDVQTAACLYVAQLRRIRKKGQNMQSEGLGAYSYSLAAPSPGAFGEIQALLAPYRRVVL